jgi:TonB family protein
MKKNINQPERKKDFNRFNFSLILSITIHLLIVLSFFSMSRINLPIKNISMQKKTTVEIQIYNFRNSPESRNSIAMKKNGTEKNNQTQVENKKNEIKKTSNNDLLAEYEKSKNAEKNKKEEDFFKNSTNNKKNEETSKLEKELQGLNNALDNSNQDNNTNKNGIKGNKNQDGSIKWENDNSRKLISTEKINIPEKYIKEGIKTSLKIKFKVFGSGLISDVDIIISSGNSSLDQEIISQFKKWKFQESSDKNLANGIIEFKIGY